MKKLFIAAALIFLTGAVYGAGIEWIKDFPQAQKLSRKENRPMLLFFTGSDWCGWCIKLNKEVLSKEIFSQWVKKRVIPVELDFPRHPDMQYQQQNQTLARQYGVQGFPSIILLNPDGSEIGRTGYKFGGADNYIKSLDKILGRAK